MTDIAVRVENLSKQDRIGGPQARYKTIRESLSEAVHAPFRRVGKLLRGEAYGAGEMDKTIWALKDVSFEVNYPPACWGASKDCPTARAELHLAGVHGIECSAK